MADPDRAQGGSSPSFGGNAAIFPLGPLPVISACGCRTSSDYDWGQGPGILEGQSQQPGFERRWVPGPGVVGHPPIATP